MKTLSFIQLLQSPTTARLNPFPCPPSFNYVWKPSITAVGVHQNNRASYFLQQVLVKMVGKLPLLKLVFSYACNFVWPILISHNRQPACLGRAVSNLVGANFVYGSLACGTKLPASYLYSLCINLSHT
jgi:hypothetical protein